MPPKWESVSFECRQCSSVLLPPDSACECKLFGFGASGKLVFDPLGRAYQIPRTCWMKRGVWSNERGGPRQEVKNSMRRCCPSCGAVRMLLPHKHEPQCCGCLTIKDGCISARCMVGSPPGRPVDVKVSVRHVFREDLGPHICRGKDEVLSDDEKEFCRLLARSPSPRHAAMELLAPSRQSPPDELANETVCFACSSPSL